MTLLRVTAFLRVSRLIKNIIFYENVFLLFLLIAVAKDCVLCAGFLFATKNEQGLFPLVPMAVSRVLYVDNNDDWLVQRPLRCCRGIFNR